MSFKPGPWTLEESVTRLNGDDIGQVEYYDLMADGDMVAEMVDADSAPLIATAPDLYAACVAFLETVEKDGGHNAVACEAAVSLARAAIARTQNPSKALSPE